MKSSGDADKRGAERREEASCLAACGSQRARACRSKGAVFVHRGALNGDSGESIQAWTGHGLHARGVYGLVPFLMALGCAAVTTFLTLKTWRLLRARELSFYRFNLKSSGKIHKAGLAFAGFAFAWIG